MLRTHSTSHSPLLCCQTLRQHVIEKYKAMSPPRPRDFGIYVETKRPAWHKHLQKEHGWELSMEEAYVKAIIDSGFSGRVYVQRSCLISDTGYVALA